MSPKIFGLLLLLAAGYSQAQPLPRHNLQYDSLATRWDEAIPLGNGLLGALVWKKGDKLRLSLDRADLWDERNAITVGKDFDFKWVHEQVRKKQYKIVQEKADEPYEKQPYPTKLPAAAIEFSLPALGEVESNTLDLATALNTITFNNGMRFHCYLHATDPVGYFSLENIPASVNLSQVMPKLALLPFNSTEKATNDNTHAGGGLQQLGYPRGTVTNSGNRIRYRQPTYDKHYFEVLVQWQKMPGGNLIGSWTISNDQPAALPRISATAKEPTGWDSHHAWWTRFWNQSSVRLPDTVIESQYYRDMYKLGAAARKSAPAITLQAIWTADNGSLPPWKGDFHNDLNTQLSYWPSYTGNRLAEAETFTDWLWSIKGKNEKYTKAFFGVEGLNVPGVATLSGEQMGGWVQYSFSPTIGAWCALHFYWQWIYSMDDNFLKTRAWPYLEATSKFLENISYLENGKWKLPLSSSPEYNDNDISAWFTDWTNYDLALAHFLYGAAAEAATALHKTQAATHWLDVKAKLPAFNTDDKGFTVAPAWPSAESHRHLSPYMAIYPLALLDDNKPGDKALIKSSLANIASLGTRAWVGYSFAWMACLYARGHEADSAVDQLKKFATNFVSSNSFHLNGDQRGGQYSDFQYRPFTLEGNFAFAQGLHELLLQSRPGYVEIFPAVPRSWTDVSFTDLRTEGAFLVSAKKENGVPVSVSIKAEKTGTLLLKLPFRTWVIRSTGHAAHQINKEGLFVIPLRAGEKLVIENGFE